MILTEEYAVLKDGTKLVRTYSTKRVQIRNKQTGETFDEAIEPQEGAGEYEETNLPIAEDDESG